jgi:hypothetical protein
LWGQADEAAAFFSEQQAGIMMTMHYVTNIEGHIDGDIARVDAMWSNPVRLLDAPQDSFFGGRWHHELVRAPDGRRSRSLHLEVVF